MFGTMLCQSKLKKSIFLNKKTIFLLNRRNEQNANRFSCGEFFVRRKKYSCRLCAFLMSAAKIVIGKTAGDSKAKVAWLKNKVDVVQKVELPIARVVQIGAKTNKNNGERGQKRVL